MQVKKISGLTGVEHVREVPVTEEQLAAWRRGEHIQLAMPNISADDREFLMTGSTPEEFEAAFGKEE